jgi:hypothetical protein
MGVPSVPAAVGCAAGKGDLAPPGFALFTTPVIRLRCGSYAGSTRRAGPVIFVSRAEFLASYPQTNSPARPFALARWVGAKFEIGSRQPRFDTGLSQRVTASDRRDYQLKRKTSSPSTRLKCASPVASFMEPSRATAAIQASFSGMRRPSVSSDREIRP